ncbi:MAG: tetratricopeptide repeat protein [Bacteroidales bacterium]|nr:tetratricopeptide repeat protein [Bacteroidales bacterium]
MKRLVFLLFLFAFVNYTVGQSQIEKIKLQLDSLPEDSSRIALLRNLASRYSKINPDSSEYFFSESIALAQKINDRDQEAQGLRLLGVLYKNQGLQDTALILYKAALDIHLQNNNEIEAAYVYNNIGIVYKNLGRYEKSIEAYIKALKLFDNKEDDRGRALVYNNIGVVHKNQNKYDLAIEYYYKALEVNKKGKQSDALASNYNNLGIVLMNLNMKDSALSCYQAALKIRTSEKDEPGMADSYVLIGNVYADRRNWTDALQNYKKAQSPLEKHHSSFSLVHLYENIASVYFKMSIKQSTESKTYLSLAEENIQKSLKLANEIDYIRGAVNAYQLMAKIYESQNRYIQAVDAYKNYNLLNDSLFNIDRASQIAMSEAKYNSEKKELEIEKLKNEKELQDEKIARQAIENRKQEIQLYALIGGLLLLLGFVFSVLRNLKIKRKANILLKEQKEEITAQNEELNQLVEEITAQKEEIESQRDLVATQKEMLQDVNLSVEKSIEYAKKIQRSILSDEALLQKHCSDYFVFYAPRDIVSGDFYWWAMLEGQLIITAADSTGHGVPGAFMSMLGISYLREIVIKEYIVHPGVILRKMRKEIITTLKQKIDKTSENWPLTVKDGMDMALICIDTATKKMLYAGANNPIYIIKTKPIKETILNENQKINLYLYNKTHWLYEIKPDKMPIAIYERMDRFQTQELQLESGDQVYLFTDGLADQFGGPEGKKFKYKAFKNLLLENAEKTMSEQKSNLYHAFHEWKAELDQVDDLLVLGIKI